MRSLAVVINALASLTAGKALVTAEAAIETVWESLCVRPRCAQFAPRVRRDYRRVGEPFPDGDPRGISPLNPRAKRIFSIATLAIWLATAIACGGQVDERDTQVERIEVFIEGPARSDNLTNALTTYYLGLLKRTDVLEVEPVEGRYASVGLMVHKYSSDRQRPSFAAGQRVPYFTGGYLKTFRASGALRTSVPLELFGSDQARDVSLSYVSSDDVVIRVAILCTKDPHDAPCGDRLKSSVIVGSRTAQKPDSNRAQ